MRRVSLFLFVAFACATVLCPGNAVADSTEWDFNKGDLSSTFGSNSMGYWYTGTPISSDVTFGTTSSFGIASMPGDSSGTAKEVMAITTPFQAKQGLAVSTGAANGGGSMINQYTLVQDVMFNGNCANSDGYSSLYVTSVTPAGGGLLARTPSGEVGVWNNGGNLDLGGWHRVATTVDAAAQSMLTYVDGTLVATQPTNYISKDGTASLAANSAFALFSAGVSNETSEWYVNAAYYTDSVLSGSAIAALGGVNANGIEANLGVPEPASIAILATGLLSLLAYAWRKWK